MRFYLLGKLFLVNKILTAWLSSPEPSAFSDILLFLNEKRRFCTAVKNWSDIFVFFSGKRGQTTAIAPAFVLSEGAFISSRVNDAPRARFSWDDPGTLRMRISSPVPETCCNRTDRYTAHHRLTGRKSGRNSVSGNRRDKCV